MLGGIPNPADGKISPDSEKFPHFEVQLPSKPCRTITNTSVITTMKRKLNEHDVPKETDTSPNEMVQFTDFGLDARLLQAVVGEKYSKPTPVQVKAIPLALEGKDILGE